MKLIKWALIFAVLLVVNLLVLECLLRVNGLCKTVIELQLDEELKSADVIYDFSPNLYQRLKSLGVENKFDTSSHKKQRRVEYWEAKEYNPYPPLSVWDSAYVVYNKNSHQKQITILRGEADATPSILVSKSRGEWTGAGDYFVTYVFYQSGLNGSHQTYDSIDWYSWKGGSYDGFEELLVFPMIVAELLVAITIVTICKRRWKAMLKEIRPHAGIHDEKS
jgi:hypothetical protein